MNPYGARGRSSVQQKQTARQLSEPPKTTSGSEREERERAREEDSRDSFLKSFSNANTPMVQLTLDQTDTGSVQSGGINKSSC